MEAERGRERERERERERMQRTVEEVYVYVNSSSTPLASMIMRCETTMFSLSVSSKVVQLSCEQCCSVPIC